MNLNTDFWQEFKLSDLFDIVAGIYHYSEEYDEGTTPYVSASNENNGVGQKINLFPDFKGNCIITGKVGCTAFYQPNDFCATSDVNIFIPKKFELNEKIGLFIVSVINASENYKWSYGRQCRVGDSKEIIIKLPVCMNKEGYLKDVKCEFSKNGFIPDWKFMEDYIKSINNKPITTKNKRGQSSPILGQTNWKECRIGDLFTIKRGSSLSIEDKDLYSGEIPCVNGTAVNNGVMCKLDQSIESIGFNLFKEPALSLSRVGNSGQVFYQNQKFFVADNAFCLKLKEQKNKYIYLFLATILNLEIIKYSYGRTVVGEKYLKTIIKLPTKGDQPDWEFMENYIKSLPYGDRI